MALKLKIARAPQSRCPSFFDSERTAVLNIRPVDVVFVKENVIQLPLIDHFSTSAASVEVPLLRFAQLVKVNGIHLVQTVQKSSMSCCRHLPFRNQFAF
jgi:hypothetical protein